MDAINESKDVQDLDAVRFGRIHAHVVTFDGAVHRIVAGEVMVDRSP